MIAAVQQRLFPDMSACVRTWVDPLLGEAEGADGQLAATYDTLFPIYQGDAQGDASGLARAPTRAARSSPLMPYDRNHR